MGSPAATEVFEEHVYALIVKIVDAEKRSLERSPEPRPYMMSLYVSDTDDDPRLPGVWLCFEHEPDPYDLADDPGLLARWQADGEGKWNYAALSQNMHNLVGYDGRNTDPNGTAIVDAMLDGLTGMDCTRRFVGALVRVVQRVHRDKLVEQQLGNPMPLLIHELEYHQVIAIQNIEANGQERAGEFVGWIRGMYASISAGSSRIAQFDQAAARAQEIFEESQRPAT